MDEETIFQHPIDEDDDAENPQQYCIGGYCPVTIGETLNERYTVERKLGWGTFSTVWQCWDEHDQQCVALKIMKSAPAATTAALTEIELLDHICRCDPDGSHKGKIVKLLDNFNVTGIHGTHVCLVFELLGQDLFTYTIDYSDKGLPLAHVKTIIKQVLEGLDFLHTTCEIIHTDIKSDNICLANNNNTAKGVMAVTIADLGNGCWVDRHFATRIQSSAHRSPEVLLEADYGPSADIWSAACTAFELATGHYLFPIHEEESRAEDRLHMIRILVLLGGIPERKILKNPLKYFTRREKLRHYPKMKSRGIFELLIKKHGWDEEKALGFTEFLLPMLAIDPHNRPSAKDSSKHYWLQF